MKKLPVKKERNEEEIPNEPVKYDHRSISGDEIEEPEVPVQETLPIQGSVKWEKPRSSASVTNKPDRWDNNVMFSKIEQDSVTEEASLPSVIEIPTTKAM